MICSIFSGRVPVSVRSTVSQPKDRACASRSAFMSPTITAAAPSSWDDTAAASPTGPAPAMYTVDLVVTPAETQPWYPVGKMSESMVRSRIFPSA